MPLLYLSPSLQPFNKYLNGGNEQYYMNQIADMMEPLLITNGIQFERNSIDTNLRAAINESNQDNYDLHLAIHSNSSPTNLSGVLKGTDVYYRPGNYKSADAAEIIANNYKKIYPDPELVKAVPTTSLAELNQTKAPAVLIETAYHDNSDDEQWIKSNLSTIAENLVESLTLYFDIPFIYPPIMPYFAKVETSGGNLNLRTKPSLDSSIITTIPNGSTVIVLGQYGDWYCVNWPVNYSEDDLMEFSNTGYFPGSFKKGITGYVSSKYIARK